MSQTAWLTSDTTLAVENFLLENAETEEDIIALEAEIDAFLDEVVDHNLSIAYESIEYAMEGTNLDALKALRTGLKEMKAWKQQMKKLARQKNYKQAAVLAKNIAGKYDGIKQQIGQLPESTASSALVGLGTTLFMLAFGALVSKGVGVAFQKIKPLKQARSAVTKKVTQHNYKSMDKARKFGPGKGTTKLDRLTDKAINKQAVSQVKGSTKLLDRVKDRQGYKNAIKSAKDGIMQGTERMVKDASGNLVGTGQFRGNGREVIRAGIKRDVAAKNYRTTKGVVDFAVGSFADSILGKFMKKKGWGSAEDAGTEPMTPNDRNAWLNMCRKICDDGKKKYLDAAAQYEAKANGSQATEAWLFD